MFFNSTVLILCSSFLTFFNIFLFFYFFFKAEFNKLKDEVPPALTNAHMKVVEEAIKEGKNVDANFGLDRSGIAGTTKDENGE